MRGISKWLVVILLVTTSVVVLGDTCNTPQATNMSGVTWQYCYVPSMVIIRNNSNVDIFVRFKAITSKSSEDFTISLTAGHSLSRQSIGPVTKVLITDWVKYNKH